MFKRRVLITLVLFASGFFFSNLLRNVNAMVAPDLMATFFLDRQELGLVTALYFISFALAQIPLGIAIDRYGTRRCQIILLGFAVIGCVLFGLAQNYLTLIIGRLAIGLGFSGSLMTGLVALMKVLPREKQPAIYGIYLAIGGLGTLFAGYPTHSLLAVFGWRGLFILFAGACLLCLCALFFYKEGEDLQQPKASVAQGWGSLSEFRRILAAPAMQAVIPFIAIANGVFMACLGIWMADFMRRVQGLSEAEIAWTISVMAIVLTFGPPFFGWLVSQRQRLFKRLSLQGFVFLLISPAPLFFMLAVLPESVSPYPAHWNWLLVAFFFSPSIQCYVLVTQNTPSQLSGRINTTLNFTLFLGGFLVQFGVGVLLQTLITGLGISEAVSYRLVMIASAVIIALCILWIPYRLRNVHEAGVTKR